MGKKCKEPGEHHPHHKAPDVSEKSYPTARLGTERKEAIDELKTKPKSQDDPGRPHCKSSKQSQGDDPLDPNTREEDQIRTQHASDRSTRTDKRDLGCGVNHDLSKDGHRPASEVKKEIIEHATSIFHIVPEQPQVKQVA